MTVICTNQEQALKCHEAMARIQIGLALEGITTSITVSEFNQEETELHLREE